MKLNILALDLGTTTGWALSQTTGEVNSGTQSFKPSRYEGGGMRFLKFNSWLSAINEAVNLSGGISHVVFEEVRNHAGVDAAHAYGGFLASLTSWCEARNIPYQGVPVGTIKASWTGKGNASKEMMMKVARERGYAPIDDNQADALAILHWAMIERKTNEAPSSAGKRPASDGQPSRRVPVGAVPVARRRTTGRES